MDVIPIFFPNNPGISLVYLTISHSYFNLYTTGEL